MKLQDSAELLILAAIWGASFMFMRTATPEFGAIVLVEVRTAIAALCLLPLLLLRRRMPDLKRHWREILFVGIVNTAVPFCLFSYATMMLGAGVGAVLNATAPMFGALIAFLWLKDRLSYLAVIGLFIGFAGVSVLASARGTVAFSLSIMPILAALGATSAYGLAACYTKRNLAGVNALAIAAGSQVFAALVLLPFAIVTWPTNSPSLDAWLQVVILGVACTGVAYILYFRLIANVGAPRAMTVGYMVPVFGVLWGVIFLDETISKALLAGAGLILFGVSLTTGFIRWRKPPATEKV